VQQWLCHPHDERGLHWRGLVLKMACWPVFLTGTVLAVLRRHIPYIPTAKEAVRGHFLRLAWPHLALVGLFAVTVARTVAERLLLVDEGQLALTSEAVWGMTVFASLAIITIGGAIYAAWTSRTIPEGQPWDNVDVAGLEG
jgi:cellulose synthase (UDP-forming)